MEERKDAKADPRRVRLAALQALREKKLAEAVTNWQRELRDKAYVEIRQGRATDRGSRGADGCPVGFLPGSDSG